MSEAPVYRRCKTRDSRHFVVREAEIADAAQIIANTRSILTEPEWSITEPAEFHPALSQEEAWIQGFSERPHNLLLVADFGAPTNPCVVGVLNFNTQPRQRMRHRGRLGIGIQMPFRGLGVGGELIRTLLDWATAEPEIERVELSVFAHNTRAIHLYQSLGFAEEARLLRAYKLTDGSYYDDVMMVKWVK